jgi:hypothetical protein
MTLGPCDIELTTQQQRFVIRKNQGMWLWREPYAEITIKLFGDWMWSVYCRSIIRQMRRQAFCMVCQQDQAARGSSGLCSRLKHAIRGPQPYRRYLPLPPAQRSPSHGLARGDLRYARKSAHSLPGFFLRSAWPRILGCPSQSKRP